MYVHKTIVLEGSIILFDTSQSIPVSYIMQLIYHLPGSRRVQPTILEM